MTEKYSDTIIVGGGPAGLTAGLYAARAKMEPLLIEKMGCGGQSIITDWIENYPGFPEGISGFELAAKIEEQARKFGINVVLDDVVKVEKEEAGNGYRITTAASVYRTLSIIVATGATHRTLDIPGEFELRGHGVSYCATCDGPFFRDKDIIVIGGGNSAVQEALFLTRFARSVRIVHRRSMFRATKVLQERALANPKIQVTWNAVVTKILGKEKVEGVTIKDLTGGQQADIMAEGVFVFTGLVPNASFMKGIVSMDQAGYIITDDNMMTTAPGVFACGDARRKLLRQVVTAVGEGATAAFAAQEYVDDLKGTGYR